MQREKTVAYACALHYWAEKTDLPTGGKPCLLAESVKELWGRDEVLPLLLRQGSF